MLFKNVLPRVPNRGRTCNVGACCDHPMKQLQKTLIGAEGILDFSSG